MKLRRKYSAAFIGVLFVISVISSSSLYALEGDSSKEIVQKSKDLNKLKKKIEECQRKKHRAEKKEKGITKDLKKIKKELRVRQRELAIYAWNLNKNKRQTKLLLRSLENLTEERKGLSGLLIEEVKLRFKKGITPYLITFPAEAGELTFYFKLEDITDKRIISFCGELDKGTISKEKEKEKLEKYRQLELVYRKRAIVKKTKTKKLSQDKEKKLKKYRKETKKSGTALKQLKEKALSLEKLIARLEKTQRAKGGFSGGHFQKLKGRLSLPVRGTLLKTRRGAGIDIYKGITIKASRGKAVISAAEGRVIYADWFRGFGNVVIIDQGDGYSTLYAHLEEGLVDKGDKVEKGQIIGRVGDSGSLTAQAELYFEIRRYGKPLDPLKWLRR